MSNATSTVNEHDVIKQVVQHYIDGARSGRGDDMRPAFHEDATIFGYAGPDLFAGPIENLFAWNDANGSAAELEAGRLQRATLATVNRGLPAIPNGKGTCRLPATRRWR